MVQSSTVSREQISENNIYIYRWCWSYYNKILYWINILNCKWKSFYFNMIWEKIITWFLLDDSFKRLELKELYLLWTINDKDNKS